MNQYLHEVAITAIIVKEGKYLITRRAATKNRLPGKWTVPGGRLEVSDYKDLPQDAEGAWYYVIERALTREVQEEVGLEITNIDYLVSIATIHGDNTPSLIISCVADYVSGEVQLQEGETDDFAWVTLGEAKEYDLIDGIYEELEMTEKKLHGEKAQWQKVSARAK